MCGGIAKAMQELGLKEHLSAVADYGQWGII